MKNIERKLMPYNLQFFAEPDDGQTNGDDGKKGNDDSNDVNGNQNASGDDKNKNDGAEKTFTQKQVNEMMTKEKKQGKQSILNALGFKTEQEAKDAVNLLKTLKDSQKSEEEKQEEAKKAALGEKEKAEQRALIAEAKLSCIENGVNKESIEDVLTIAMSKVSDDKKLEDVIADMKKEKRYSSFFVEGNNGGNSNGTGSTPQHSSSQGKGDNNYGKQLAEKFNAKKSVETKSKFF